MQTGKGLGGSSNVNAMFYSRGSPNDYNAWAAIANDSAWSYENVLKAFKRVEKYGSTSQDPGRFSNTNN